MGKLDDTTAIITGSATGQGSAEARLFAEEGAHVVIADIKEDEGRALAGDLGKRARYVRHDVSRSEDWDRLVSGLTDEPDGPPLRVLVNNAAIHWPRPLEFEVEEDVMRMWRVDLLGPLLGMRAVVPLMRAAGGGSIVNISSTAGLMGLPYLSAYGAAKWGLRGLTKTAAVELGPDAIRVNSIHPGPIDTPMLRKSPTYLTRAPQDRYRHIPLGRAGQEGEVARLALFLASADSSFVTGAEVAIDGGMTAGRPADYPWQASPESGARPA